MWLDTGVGIEECRADTAEGLYNEVSGIILESPYTDLHSNSWYVDRPELHILRRSPVYLILSRIVELRTAVEGWFQQKAEGMPHDDRS